MLWFQRRNECRKRRPLRDRHQNGPHPAVELRILRLAGRRPLSWTSKRQRFGAVGLATCRQSKPDPSRNVAALNSDLLPDPGTPLVVPPVSFWKRDRGTTRHTLFEAIFWAIWTAVRSVQRILGSSHRSPMAAQAGV